MSAVYLCKIVVRETDTLVRAWLPAPECTLNSCCKECNERWGNRVEWCGIVTDTLGRFLARIEPLPSKKNRKYIICEKTGTLSKGIISRNNSEIQDIPFRYLLKFYVRELHASVAVTPETAHIAYATPERKGSRKTIPARFDTVLVNEGNSADGTRNGIKGTY